MFHVHLVDALLHRDLLNTLEGEPLEHAELAVLLRLHRAQVEPLGHVRGHLRPGRQRHRHARVVAGGGGEVGDLIQADVLLLQV